MTKISKKPVCIHALGVISKKDSTKIGLITDCHRPLHVLVNNHMSKVLDSFIFVSFDHVVAKIVEGKNSI